MSEQKLRKFRLIDKEGYFSEDCNNPSYYNDYYLLKNYYEGYVDSYGDLWCKDRFILLIDESEFQFFEEIPLEEEDINQEDNIQQQPPLNAISATFSDEMIHCIKEDCHAVNGSLCFYKEGVVFLWNEDEYFIESVDDYNKVINSIKVLNTFKK